MVGRLAAIVNAHLGRRFWVWAAILAGLAVALDLHSPLFDVLG